MKAFGRMMGLPQFSSGHQRHSKSATADRLFLGDLLLGVALVCTGKLSRRLACRSLGTGGCEIFFKALLLARADVEYAAQRLEEAFNLQQT
jgi:hypothetical protein